MTTYYCGIKKIIVG